MSYRIHIVALAIGVLWDSAAFAQGSYVSAAVLADVVRTTRTEYPGAPESAGGGEAIGFALRAGTPLGAIWGVEVEFVRPGEIEHEIASGIRLADLPRGVVVPPLVGELPAGVQILPGLVPPSFSYRVRTTERNATLSAALWIQQQLTARFAMVYLGGVAFTRSEFENEVTYAPLILGPPQLAPVILPPTRSDTTIYGVQPMVGVESRLEMTRHAHLVPGLRMHASDGRWLIRPSIGLSWTF